MTMDEARFRALLNAYGADQKRWPEAERAAAAAFAAEQPDVAEHALNEAAALDRQLDAAPTQEPSAALMGRVLASAPTGASRPRDLAAAGAQAGSWWRGLASGWGGPAWPQGAAGAARVRIAGGLALALLASVGVGYGVGAMQATRDVGEALIDVAFTSAYTGLRLDG